MKKVKEIYQGSVIDVRLETSRLPDGHVMDFECVRHSGGATIAAVNDDNQVCLIKQYRHCIDGWLVELPAGKMDPPEPPELTAKRELQEETGVTAGIWHTLGGVYSTPGFCDEIIHCYLARNLTLGKTALENGELISTQWVPMKNAVDMALNGQIEDAKSIICLLRAYAWLNSHG